MPACVRIIFHTPLFTKKHLLIQLFLDHGQCKGKKKNRQKMIWGRSSKDILNTIWVWSLPASGPACLRSLGQTGSPSLLLLKMWQPRLAQWGGFGPSAGGTAYCGCRSELDQVIVLFTGCVRLVAVSQQASQQTVRLNLLCKLTCLETFA